MAKPVNVPASQTEVDMTPRPPAPAQAPSPASVATAVKGLTGKRKTVALAIAGASDLLQVALAPLFGEGGASPAEDALDLATAAVLLSVLGFEWRLVAAFMMELIPGATLFPTWTAAVLSLPVTAGELPAPANGQVPKLSAR
jgi:hypothetical protein